MKNFQFDYEIGVLTQEELKLHIKYDPTSGKFTRIGYRDRYKNIVKCNYEITGVNSKTYNGYRRVNVLGRRYLLHKLAFLYVKGYIPKNVDHVDGNKLNNAFSNLREVTHQENMMNKKRYINNPLGYAGVGKKENKYYALTQKNGLREFAGYFNTIEEAINARKEMEKRLGFHKNHGKVR